MKPLHVSELAAWECRARPAALSGRPCGHLNASGGTLGPGMAGARLVCCEACGCTKIASDDRARREQKMVAREQLALGGVG